MTRAELESKHLAELHSLADRANVPRYRMLSRNELIEKLAGGESKGRRGGQRDEAGQRPSRERRPRGGRQRSDRGAGPERGGGPERGAGGSRPPKAKPSEQPAEQASGESRAVPEPSTAPATTPPPARPKRRRRRRFRRRKDVRVHDLLLPPVAGRQAIVYAETREGCTALLRELAADLSGQKGPDPIALLVDPSPEELADWKREAPAAEIVSAGQERHASDALAQAGRRADGGEDVILLIDSLSRFAEAFGDPDSARELFDAGLSSGRAGNGSLTVVAALERPQ
ncbi:MAG TPA: hypothetical protein VFL89_04765 [Solirubrobacterales bacterium]|nr:hypothetical protein [Solirubrobacterales bacterium]